jgi:seryl-tRNA(Sec) selenium transferase
MISSFEKKFFEVVISMVPNVPCVQAICMTRHCKLYSGKIIEFQNFTIAPINQ